MSEFGEKNKGRLAAHYVVRVAFLAATLTALKLALSFLPNVEVVTVLIIAYGSALGVGYALPATLIFCSVEVAMYGVGSWVPLYFVYWPLLALLSSLLLRGRRVWLAVILGVVGSVLFGALSACMDTLFVLPYIELANVGKYFAAYYLRGVYFDVVHVLSSLVTVILLYMPLVGALRQVMREVYLRHVVLRKGLGRFPDEYFREG